MTRNRQMALLGRERFLLKGKKGGGRRLDLDKMLPFREEKGKRGDFLSVLGGQKRKGR